MIPINFYKASPRRTECYIVEIGCVTLTISYNTVIAVSGRLGGNYIGVRRDNEWGPTTGRHINENGLRDWPVVSHHELEKTINAMLIEQAMDEAARRFKQAA